MTDNRHPAQKRTDMRKDAERKASAQALIDYFAKHDPEILVKQKTECLEAAVKRGLSGEEAVNDARRHLIARLRFLSENKS
jgi:hypothetical protein